MRAATVAIEASALLHVKVRAPQPRDLIQRPRLMAQLDAGMANRLTLVVAPAGSGKTTLLSAWSTTLAARGVPVAWLSLDAGENDLAHFLRYVIAALRSASPAVGEGVLALLQSPPLPSVEALMTPLVNDLAASPSPMVMLLDDYHVIDASLIHTALTFLLDHLPPRMHLVLAARADPPLPLARLRARGELSELRAAELRFTRDEAEAFLGGVMGLRLPANEIVELEARTEGWIAGLQLAALSLRGQADTAGLIAAFAGSHRFLVDYLTEEVLQRQPEPVQSFLMQTAILDRLCPDLCNAVTGRADGHVQLEHLERAGLFLIGLDDERRWYRYHHLFADFLRQRLRRVQPERMRELHLRACEWYTAHGLLREAIDHALGAENYTVAGRLIEQIAKTLIWHWGEQTTILRWLERFPPSRMQEWPQLCLEYAWAVVWSGDASRVASALREAERAVNAATSRSALASDEADMASNARLTGELATLSAALSYLSGDVQAMIATSQQALELLGEEQWELRSLAFMVHGLGQRLRRQITGAIASHASSAQAGTASGSYVVAAVATGLVIQDHLLAGKLREAERVYQQMRDQTKEWLSPESAHFGPADIYLGELLRERNEVDAAERHLRQGVERCAQVGAQWEYALDGLLSLARVHRQRGDLDTALHLIEQAEHFAFIPLLAERIAAARTSMLLAAGDLDAATRWAAGRSPTLQADGDLQPVYWDEYLLLARIRLHQGAIDEALQLLMALLPLAEAGGYGRGVLEALILQAVVHSAAGKTDAALQSLRRALTIAEPEGYVRTFVDEGAPMSTLLREALQKGIASAYVSKLLSAFGHSSASPQAGKTLRRPRTPAPVAQPVVEPLSEREREILRLVAAGLSTAEIAHALVIARGTVKNHLKHIFGKLDAHSRLQAVERARIRGFL